MQPDPVVQAADHPANRGYRRHREALVHPGIPSVARPSDYERPYDSLGTHPDLVQHLWDELGAVPPVDCRYVFFGAPVLMRPDSGIVFGFASGTHTYALRLPAAEREAALAAGAKRVYTYPRHPPFDLEEIGPAWVFCEWQRAEREWCQAAYDYAGEP